MTAEEIQSAYELETANVIVERFENIDPTEVCAVLVQMALKALQLNPHAQAVSTPCSTSISYVNTEQMPITAKNPENRHRLGVIA